MIIRTFHCPECNFRQEVTLTSDQWDSQPPNCPSCAAWDLQEKMQQEFKPPAIVGSVGAKARAIAEDIIANDYNVANIRFDNREGGTSKVRYKDETPGLTPGAWQAAQATLQQAVDVGRRQRQTRYPSGPQGNALDVLQGALRTGAQGDLIEASKRRAIKVW